MGTGQARGTRRSERCGKSGPHGPCLALYFPFSPTFRVLNAGGLAMKGNVENLDFICRLSQ
jgi:hypothetical protein